MEEYEYIKVRKDLLEKYGFNTAIVLQFLIGLEDSFVGTLHNLTDRIDSISYDAVKRAISELMKCGAIEQMKVSPQSYKITIKDLTKIPVRYQKEKRANKSPNNERLRKLVEQIERDKLNKMR